MVLMFLKDINITIIEACFADIEKLRLKADLSDDITEVMPYLNTVISNAIFNKNTSLLTFTKESRLIAIYPKNLTVAKVTDSDDAYNVVGWLKNLINETWENRATITPNYERKEKPTSAQVYNWFPKLNCGKCGEANCYAYVVKLLYGMQQINNCAPLFTQDFCEARKFIMEIL